MLWKLRSFAPIVVLTTLSAVPLAELIVLPVPCTFRAPSRVPPPVALKPMPVVVVMSRPLPAALKLIVAPVLLVRLTAVSRAGAQRSWSGR